MDEDKVDLLESIKAVRHRLEQAEAEVADETVTSGSQLEVAILLSGLGELMREHARELRNKSTGTSATP
jgi:hypothetical protein